jgi:cytochrome c oxidase assembly factor CtaG
MTIWADANGWPVPPTVLLGCLVAEVLYFRGWRVFVKAVQAREAARATKPTLFTGGGTGKEQWNTWLWRGIFFLCAIFTFLIASSAPVDILSARFFWVHMVQHLLLLVIMPPLLVASAPLIPLWLGLPRWARRFLKRLRLGYGFYRLGQWLRQPAITCTLLVMGIWVWHWPPLYDLALTNGLVHDWCEHATFVAVSTLFWTQVIPSPPLHLRAGYLGRIICVGVAVAQNLALAVLIGFAQTPLYAPYAHLGAAGGGWLTPILDQQLGAGIMWTFGDLPFGIALAVLFGRWLASEDTSAAPQHRDMHAVNEQRA